MRIKAWKKNNLRVGNCGPQSAGDAHGVVVVLLELVLLGQCLSQNPGAESSWGEHLPADAMFLEPR